MNGMEVRGLNVKYRTDTGAVQTVESVSFSVEKGKTAGLVGESGSGKTTAVLAACGLLGERADVSAEQITVSGGPPVPGKNVAVIFQNAMNCLNPTVKIGNQITETIRVRRKCRRAEAKQRAEKLLELVGFSNPEQKMRQYPFEMSGGERQRVVTAVALACEPDVIIADEPTTALDPPVRVQIVLLLRRIVEKTGTALLLVSHDMGVTVALCDTIYVMQGGKILESGTAENIFYFPEQEYTKQLLLECRGRKNLACGKTEGEVLLRLEHVSKHFEAGEALCDLSMEIRAGETVALVGESGSGKTTLARILTGLEEADSGNIYYRGQKIGRDRHAHGEPDRIQMVFQDPYGALNPCLTVRRALEEALFCFRRKRTGPGRRKNPLYRDQDEIREKVDEMLELVGLAPADALKYPGELSGGQRQRAAMARALIAEPELLICDEALSALDMPSRSQMLSLLRHVSRESGIACLFISHDLQTVREISERTVVMYGGRIVESGITEQVYPDPWHPYTKVLTDSVLRPDPIRAGKIRAPFEPEEEQAEKPADSGCVFAVRCGYSAACCRKECPESLKFGERTVRCFLYSEKHSGKRAENYRMTSQI